MTRPITKSDVEAYLEIVKAVALIIRQKGEIPSGHLYTMLQLHAPSIDLDGYNRILDHILKTGLVERQRSHLLVWKGQPTGKENGPVNGPLPHA